MPPAKVEVAVEDVAKIAATCGVDVVTRFFNPSVETSMLPFRFCKATVPVAVILPATKLVVVAFDVVALVRLELVAVSAPTLILLAMSVVIFARVEVNVSITPVVNLPTDAKKLVVVAAVPVAFRKVKFWSVVEAPARKFAAEIVPVADPFAICISPENNPLPWTESL